MQLDLRHLATTARFGAGREDYNPQNTQRQRSPIQGPASSQCPSGFVVLGAAGRAGSPARERASGRGAARRADWAASAALSGAGARSASACVARAAWAGGGAGVSVSREAPAPQVPVRLRVRPRVRVARRSPSIFWLRTCPAHLPPARPAFPGSVTRPGPAPRSPRAAPGARRSAG